MDAKVTFIFIDFNLEHHIFQCKNNEKNGPNFHQIFHQRENKFKRL